MEGRAAVDAYSGEEEEHEYVFGTNISVNVHNKIFDYGSLGGHYCAAERSTQQLECFDT